MENNQDILQWLYDSLDSRKAPEVVAGKIMNLEGLPNIVRRSLKKISRDYWLSWMSDDFFRGNPTFDKQLETVSKLFKTNKPANDTVAILSFLQKIEPIIGKKIGKNDYKYDRLSSIQRKEAGIIIPRRQYNKAFRLVAKLEKKLERYNVATLKRSLTLASKSRLASKLTFEEFTSDLTTAAFIAYYVSRCNLRSIFTCGQQKRPYDQICEKFMATMSGCGTTNWYAIAYAMPDEHIVSRLTEEQKGLLLGNYYEMLVQAADVLEDLWNHNDINFSKMIVKRGNDSSTWNLVAGAWNKLRDGWFSLCYAMKADDVIEKQCPGKVMRLMAADVAWWHEETGDGQHTDTDVWADLPLPWEVIKGKDVCTRNDIQSACAKLNIDPYKNGWLARRGKKKVEKFTPTPELVHGVIVSNPFLAQTLRKIGVFSGKPIKSELDIESVSLIDEVREAHYLSQMSD